MTLPTEEQVRDALRGVDDPEIGINIIDLGLVYEIDISTGRVLIKMTMTTPTCPMHSYLSAATRQVICRRFPNVTDVDIELVWDPPWDPAKMSAAAKKQLGWTTEDHGAA